LPARQKSMIFDGFDDGSRSDLWWAIW